MNGSRYKAKKKIPVFLMTLEKKHSQSVGKTSFIFFYFIFSNPSERSFLLKISKSKQWPHRQMINCLLVNHIFT